MEPVAPEVTFITPVFDAEETLPAALDRILGQETKRPFEVVIVDDGSRDRSYELAEKIAAAHPGRVKALTKKNGGEASALNVGFREARGRFLAIVEGAVEIDPKWLETCLAVLESEPLCARGGQQIVAGQP